MSESTMSASVQKPATIDPTKLGECAAVQPLSGVTSVDETFAVNGLGRGGYVRKEENAKTKGRV
jgi:hypothetical protein